MGQSSFDNVNKVEFSGLILGFGSAALTYMGIMSDGSYEGGGKNLALAKQHIDIIEMLRDKTQGNLSNDEKKLIEQILSDLQLKYVEAKK